MASGFKSRVTDWALYKPDIILNSDYRKFDDMLRVVINGTKNQRHQLENFLSAEYQKSNLAYGIHISKTAMITCMVFQYHRNHIHFVDGCKGGYVAASKDLKKRLTNLEKVD